jgi:hypothetical protein
MSYTQPQPTLPIVSGNWLAQLLRGIAAVLFGVILGFLPGAGLVTERNGGPRLQAGVPSTRLGLERRPPRKDDSA